MITVKFLKGTGAHFGKKAKSSLLDMTLAQFVKITDLSPLDYYGETISGKIDRLIVHLDPEDAAKGWKPGYYTVPGSCAAACMKLQIHG